MNNLMQRCRGAEIRAQRRNGAETLTLMWVWAIILVLTACTRQGGALQPSSGGRMYEVLVVGDRDSLVRGVLQQDAPGLPQQEPLFDVSSIDSVAFGIGVRQARTIVMVTIRPDIATQTTLRYEKDVYAAPQIIATLVSPSMAQLRKDLPRLAPRLRQLLDRAELNTLIAELRRHRNVKMEQKVRERFGITPCIPADMVASKEGRDFHWMSNNSATAMQNIVIYRTSRLCALPEAYCRQRDSVMQANIKGETDAMFMQTVPGTVTATRTTIGQRPVIVHRGLWEMRGDAMGGPFVSHTIKTDSGYLTVEGFVFAPGTKKRNKMKQLEAALCTLND